MKNSFIHRAWTVIFTFLYPVVMVFSALLLILNKIMSYPSRLLRKIFSKINLPNQKSN